MAKKASARNTKRENIKNIQTCSMTGFAAVRKENKNCVIDLELKSVNHRYLEMVFRTPREFSAIEGDSRKLIGQELQRGRVEVFLSSTNKSTDLRTLVDPQYAKSAVTTFKELCKIHGAKNPAIDKFLTELVLRKSAPEEKKELSAEQAKLAQSALKEGLLQLVEMRKKEGVRLAKDIKERLAQLDAGNHAIRKLAASAPKVIREKLVERVRTLASEVEPDSARFDAEVAFLADRVDVTEELVRLDSHLKSFSENLPMRGQGRRLDFLAQEILRELNTIGSKAQDAKVQKLVVDAKVTLEKIKEQIQNIE